MRTLLAAATLPLFLIGCAADDSLDGPEDLSCMDRYSVEAGYEYPTNAGDIAAMCEEGGGVGSDCDADTVMTQAAAVCIANEELGARPEWDASLGFDPFALRMVWHLHRPIDIDGDTGMEHIDIESHRGAVLDAWQTLDDDFYSDC